MSGLWLTRARANHPKTGTVLAHASFDGVLTDRHLSGGWVKGGTWSYATAPSGFDRELNLSGAGGVYSKYAIDLGLGTADFTAECFCSYAAATQESAVLAQSNSAADGAFRIERQGSDYRVLLGNAGGGWTIMPSAPAPAVGVRHHVALVRRGAVFTLYVSGQAVSVMTYTGALHAYTANLVVGTLWFYITSVRLKIK